MDQTALGAIIGVLVGMILPLLFATFLPNAKFYNWGVSVGKKMSAEGNKIIGKNYEQLENNLTGSMLSFSQGVKDGAAQDNA